MEIADARPHTSRHVTFVFLIINKKILARNSETECGTTSVFCLYHTSTSYIEWDFRPPYKFNLKFIIKPQIEITYHKTIGLWLIFHFIIMTSCLFSSQISV